MPESDPGDHAAMARKYRLTEAHGEYGRKGLRTDGKITFGSNSGHQAIHLAYNLGAARILLLGYDFGGGGHWFGEHPPDLNCGHDYGLWLSEIEHLAHGLARQGVQVINCSRSTAITCFPRMAIEDVDPDRTQR